MSAPEKPRYDGSRAAAHLSRAQRDQLAGLALEMVVAQDGALKCELRSEERPYQAAEALIRGEVCEIAAGVLPDELAGPAKPPIPACIGTICRVCGCSEHDACDGPDGPCGWAERDLCTHCVPAEVAAC